MPSISYKNEPNEIQRTITPGTIFVTQNLEHLILCFDQDEVDGKYTLIDAENMKVVRDDLNAIPHVINYIKKYHSEDYTIIYPHEYSIVVNK